MMCVVSGDPSVLVWLVLVRELGKERKIEEIVNVSVSTWYHDLNDCL